eukprot:scaffold72311_cov39-Cyclotella_meneghiniana.AAC.2
MAVCRVRPCGMRTSSPRAHYVTEPLTRSEARAILESFDSEAMSLQTSEVKRLSRCHLEDLFALTEGDPLKFYVSQEAALMDKEWWGDVFIQAKRELPESETTTRINGKEYHCFDVNILHARLHDSMRAGLVSEPDLHDYYDKNEGFSITFGGYDHLKLTFKWKQVVQYSSSFIHETAGDYTSSFALINAYLSAENKILSKKATPSSRPTTPTLHTEFVPDGGTSVLTVINEDCKRAFHDAVFGWTDPQAPLLSEETYKSWIDMMKVQYMAVWMNLSKFRGITGSTRGIELVPGKERQVLHQILSQFRNRNSRLLTWWALIESVALMAWSMSRTALDKMNYWGSHVFSTSRDRMLNSIFGNEHVQSIKEAFAVATVIIFIIDNYQKGQRGMMRSTRDVSSGGRDGGMLGGGD